MIIIIDGYNFLKHQDPDREINEMQRRAFLNQISQYGRHKKHKMVVVFDGGPHDWPYKEKIAGVMTIFSGQRQSADKVIMHYLEDHKNKELLLVSSDHELNLFASKREVVSIGSEEFNYLLKQTLQSMPEKYHDQQINFDETESDLDIIMEQAAEHIPSKLEDMPKNRKAAPLSKFSKKDRALLKKLKKL